ncbi:MAG TPA: hypothetical protein VFK05_06050 [Polyangiaceae bacterium]|nr:hypothetical protein [Polyangiaceae bacterium]
MSKANIVFGASVLAFALQLSCSEAFDTPRAVEAGSAGAATGATADGGASGTVPASPSGAAGSGEPRVLEAPDDAPALLSFLEAQQYAEWPKEAETHPSAGPHGERVRVYYSPSAARALKGGASSLPAGAASVKELTTSDGTLSGYSVWVKVQEASDGGNGFFWYERVRRPDGSDAVYGNARGSSVCVGCHSAGQDYSLSTLPFE